MTNDSSQELCRIIYEWLLFDEIMHSCCVFLGNKKRRIVVIGVWHVLTHSTNKTTTNFKCWVNEPEINDINNKLDSSFALFSSLFYFFLVFVLFGVFNLLLHIYFVVSFHFCFSNRKKLNEMKWNKNTTTHFLWTSSKKKYLYII